MPKRFIYGVEEGNVDAFGRKTTTTKKKKKKKIQKVNVIVISIGTAERARDFCRENEFPMEVISPIRTTSPTTLRLNFGVKETLFDASTPYSILERIQSGKFKELTDVLRQWKPWIPPKREHWGCNKVGRLCLIRRGKGDGAAVEYECVYDWYDPSTGAHAPIEEILKACEIES